MLKLSDLCKGYVDGGEFHPVLQGAELTLQQGEQVALMGRVDQVKVPYLT